MKLDAHEHGEGHAQQTHELLVPLKRFDAFAVAHRPASHQVENADGTNGAKRRRDEKEPAEVRNQRYPH